MMAAAVALILFCFLCVLFALGAFIVDWFDSEQGELVDFEERA